MTKNTLKANLIFKAIAGLFVVLGGIFLIAFGVSYVPKSGILVNHVKESIVFAYLYAAGLSFVLAGLVYIVETIYMAVIKRRVLTNASKDAALIKEGKSIRKERAKLAKQELKTGKKTSKVQKSKAKNLAKEKALLDKKEAEHNLALGLADEATKAADKVAADKAAAKASKKSLSFKIRK